VSSIVVIDGQERPAAEQHVSVFDRGFLYGDSVFETLRTYAGVPFALWQHLERLARSAERVFIQMPIPLTELSEEVLTALRRRAAHGESYLRIMLTRGEAVLGLDPALARRPRRVIMALPLSLPPPHYYSVGVGACSYVTQRQVEGTSAEGAKIGNYLVSVLAMREAGLIGAVEALIVDARGRVLEGSSSNVFLVRAGQLVTAPTEAGILAGITRAHVLALAQVLGIPVELRAPELHEVRQADELFITSSIRELLPIVRLDQQPVGAGTPGPVFGRLLQAFRERVGSA
jgi:branched-chain amino acid aminotransferase